jgi:hypothetical protein
MNGTVSGYSEDGERPTVQYNAKCASQLQNNSHLFFQISLTLGTFQCFMYVTTYRG